MTRQELYQLLEKGPVFLDGATGTMLQEAGLPVGVCPEKLDHGTSRCYPESAEGLCGGGNTDSLCSHLHGKPD